MKWLALGFAVAMVPLISPVAAQEKKAPARKPAAARRMPAGKAHRAPTPEQIRKFDQLEKKQGR